MARPFSPSYPVTGKQARQLLKDIEKVNRGEIDPEEKRKQEKNFERAIDLFNNFNFPIL